MNILFLSWEYPPNGSGIGNYVAEMSSALVLAGHSVTVLTSRATGLPEEDRISDVQVLRIFDRNELRSGRVARLAVDVARDCQADWIEVPDHWGEGAALLKLRQRPPVVVKMHYNDVLKALRYAQAKYAWQKITICLACLRQLRSFRAERFSIQNADILLAPCQRILDEALEQGLKLPSKRFVVPNPIRRLAEWENAEAKHPTLLLAGRIDIGKGLQYIPGLLKSLVSDFPDLILEIAGGDSYARGLGSTRKWFESQLGDMRKHVRFLGFLREDEMNAAYRRAWVVIVPSRWDTFPHVVLESMIRGKAIVVSRNGGMPEMLSDTQCGVCDPSSPQFAKNIAEFFRSHDTRHDAGVSARTKAATEYSPARTVQKYISSCSKLMNQYCC